MINLANRNKAYVIMKKPFFPKIYKFSCLSLLLVADLQIYLCLNNLFNWRQYISILKLTENPTRNGTITRACVGKEAFFRPISKGSNH